MLKEEHARQNFHSKAFMPSFGLDEMQYGQLQADLAEMPIHQRAELTAEMIARDEERKERQQRMAEKRARQQQTSTSVTKKKVSPRAQEESPPRVSLKGRAINPKKGRSLSKHKKDTSRQLGKGNPIDLNDGDAELQPHFDPLIAAAGGNLQELLNTKASHNDDTV